MNENENNSVFMNTDEATNDAFVYPEHPAPQTTPAKPKKNRKGLKIAALGLCCAIVGGLFGMGGAMLIKGEDGESASHKESTTVYMSDRKTEAVNVAYVGSGEPMTAPQVYATNVNSTVGITTSVTTNFWGYQTTSAASGSGFILTEDGYILTCYHVVEDSDSITVSLYDGTTYDAELIGYDESNDIAVLKVEAEGLSAVVLGDSDSLLVGDDVIAIGNPLGELTFSLTAGVVSALGREITLSSGVTMALIQTDCAINSGNSGGALYNMYGEVIGITNAKYSGSGSASEASIDNIGFAIPINSVKTIVSSIIEKGYIAKPYIGISVTDVGEEATSYGLPEGAAVKAVTEDSPAEKAGLEENDIITAVNGTEITGSSDLVAIVKAAAVGDKLELSIYRQGEEKTVTVTVEEQITSALQEEEEAAQKQQEQQESQQDGSWGYQGDSGDFGSLPWGYFFGY